MPSERVGKWKYGRIISVDGKNVWVLEAMRRGVRYSIALSAKCEEDALAEGVLFERDPVAFKAAHKRNTAAMTDHAPLLTEHNVGEFLRYKKGKVTHEHAKDLGYYLQGWLLKAPKDLRDLTVADYRVILKALGEPERKYISAIRSFTTWLREQGMFGNSYDASRDLKIPQADARRAKRSVGYSLEQFEKLYAAIRTRKYVRQDDVLPAQAVRDVLALRALCGMHHREVERLAEGQRKVRRLKGQGEIAGVVTFLHKKGTPHPQALCAKALAAAERLQARGHAPAKEVMYRVIQEARESAGLPKMNAGELRHSFVTWARTYGRLVRPVKDAGVPVEEIAAVVGHTTVKTTGLYDDTEIPPLIILPLKLENVEDPGYVAPATPVAPPPAKGVLAELGLE